MNINQLFGVPFSLQSLMMWEYSKHIFEENKVYSEEVQRFKLVSYYSVCPQDTELHHLMVNAAKTAFDLHISNELLLFGKSSSRVSLLIGSSNCLEEEAIISATQDTPRLFVTSADIKVLEVPHKDQGLQT